jgi:N-acetylmuramoyl-L-alanine amidase
VPAVLVELGFVSNPEQARRLASPAFEHQLAGALDGAVVDAFGRS